MHRMARVAVLPLVFLAACARPGAGPSQAPPAAAVEAPRASAAVATPAPQVTPPAPPAAAPSAPPRPPSARVAQAAGSAVAAAKAAPSGGGAARVPAKPSTAHPAKPPAGEERAAPAKPAAAANASPPPPAQPALDLPGLEDRLRNTRAIGVFTKLSLKNNVDDLIAAFRAFYGGQLKTTLGDLRQRYDGLVMKVLTLVQNGDPPLAQALSASREPIWGILSDREKFQNFSRH